MKSRPIVAMTLATLLVAACNGDKPPSPAEPPAEPTRTQVRLIVELAHGTEADRVRIDAGRYFDAAVELEPLFADIDPADDPYRLGNIYRLTVVTGRAIGSPWDAAYELRETAGLINAEPDFENVLVNAAERAAGACLNGNDDDSNVDPAWSLRALGAHRAWALPPRPDGRRFGEGVDICHLDTGWTRHVDLDAERIDRTRDYDVIDDDDDAEDPLDYGGNRGHGTATGSVIASGGGVGDDGGTLPPGIVTGVAPGATLVPIRTIKSVVQFLDSDVAKGVRRAVAAQCDVISMSLGGRAFFGLERALRDAVDRGVIPVAAAGNCVGFTVAPASYDATIAVAATNAASTPWAGSSKGEAVDIAAPGERVHVARIKEISDPLDTVVRSDGTSFATAEIAGAAALWIAFHGDDAIQAAQGARTRKALFLEQLTKTANVPAGWDSEKYGAGIADLEALLAEPLPPPADGARTATAASDTLTLLARTTDRDEAELGAALRRLFGSDDLDAVLERYGAELLHVAASEPETLANSLATIDDQTADASRRARRGLDAVVSTTLRNRLESAGANQ